MLKTFYLFSALVLLTNCGAEVRSFLNEGKISDMTYSHGKRRGHKPKPSPSPSVSPMPSTSPSPSPSSNPSPSVSPMPSTSPSPSPLSSPAGVPVDGFPNWAERVLLEWTNRARVDPSVEMSACGTNCGEAACYTAMGPVRWNYKLNRAARFNSKFSAQNLGYLTHTTPCSLVSNLNSLYPASCDAPTSCACIDGKLEGSTTFSARVQLFGISPNGEIIASPADPDYAFRLWIREPSSSATCSFSSSNGHRWLILKSQGSVGFGVDGYSTGDFSSLTASAYPIPSGAHYPRYGTSVELWANWFSSSSATAGQVNIQGICSDLVLTRGSSTNGAWKFTAGGLTGCNRYYFSFKNSSGISYTYPEMGSFGIGDSTCPDWTSTRPEIGAGCVQ